MKTFEKLNWKIFELTLAKKRIVFHHLFHKIFRFLERWNPLVLFNNPGSRIIGSKCQR